LHQVGTSLLIICVGFCICFPQRSTGLPSGHYGSYTIVSHFDHQRHWRENRGKDRCDEMTRMKM